MILAMLEDAMLFDPRMIIDHAGIFQHMPNTDPFALGTKQLLLSLAYLYANQILSILNAT